MEDVENKGSQPEMAVEEIAAPETESAQENLQSNVVQEDRNERNWRELNRSKEEWKRKAQMYEELLPKVMTQQPVSQPKIEEDLIQEIAKEDYVPGQKVAKALKNQKDEYTKQLEELKNLLQQKTYSDSISELKREYPDLEDVVNPETLQIVKEKNPRLAKAWQGLDDYSIYVQAYPYIKNEILKEVPNSRRVKEVEKKIEQNKKTVQSPAAYGDKRPLAQAFDYARLTEAQKQDLQNEMHNYARLAGGY